MFGLNEEGGIDRGSVYQCGVTRFFSIFFKDFAYAYDAAESYPGRRVVWGSHYMGCTRNGVK